LINLNHNIYHLDAHYIKEGIASIYIIVENGKCAIIETGTNNSISYVLNALKKLNLSTDDVLFIIPTHIHLDHIGGASLLIKHCQNAKLVVHPYGAKHIINPEKLIAGTKAVYGEKTFKKLYGEITPINKEKVIEIKDGAVDLNGRILKIIDTPGHANHHFCIFDKKSNGVFTGDTLGVAYPQLSSNNTHFVFPTTTPVQFNPEKMLDSIDKICALKPHYFFLTHFGQVKNTINFIQQLKKYIKDFVLIAKKSQDIKYDIQNYLLTELSKTNNSLTQEQQISILKGDISLNAQGLKVWLEKCKMTNL